MILIDGSIGYGQVLRTAIGLSALALEPVRIINIRKNRPKPGLMAQHLTGIQVAAAFTDADVKGLKLHSTEIEFVPKKHMIRDKKIDIGTAGSIGLLLQTLTPLLIFADHDVTLDIFGGTAGLGSPTMQYIQHVTFPVLNKLGVNVPEIEIIREGFYPKGQGHVHITFHPTKKLDSIKLTERGKIKSIKGISVSSYILPEDIATRQAFGAKKIFIENNFPDAQIEKQITNSASPGTSITLWADCENTIIGSDVLGEKGKPAEKVGREAAGEMIKSLKSNAPLDKHMSDQIIPFIALAKGSSEIMIEEFTEHCRSNIMATEKILGMKFDLDEEKRIIRV